MRLQGRETVTIEDLLVRHEDLVSADDLSEWDALVLPPLLDCFLRFDEDDEVVACALVMDLGLVGVTAHVECLFGFDGMGGSLLCKRLRAWRERGLG